MDEAMEAVAVAAAQAGAAELRARYRASDDEADYGTYDVKAAADEAAEARMLPVVRRAYPDHAVFAEEAGAFPGENYRWIVDPLDGTNNFAAGLPTFASSVAVEETGAGKADAGEAGVREAGAEEWGPEGTPLLAVVVLPATGELYVARRGEGVRYEGETVTADSDVAPDASTAVLVVGRDVPRDPDLTERAAAIRAAVDGAVKRVVDSWAPTVHSGLFARGRIQGLVQFHPDEEEQVVTELLAREAGAATHRDGPLFLAAVDEARLDALRDAVER